MDKNQLEALEKYWRKYCLLRLVHNNKAFYPQKELANNPNDRQEIKNLLDKLTKDDLNNPKYKEKLDCLKV